MHFRSFVAAIILLLGVVFAATAAPVGTISDIQSMVSALPKDGAYLQVPAGEYSGDGNISFNGFTSGGTGGRTVIDMSGVWLSGSGYIMVDSTKRLTLTGLRAQKHEVLIKGMWWSTFNDVEVASIQFTGPGASFSSTYWNNFNGGMTQRIIFNENMAGPANALYFRGMTIRSKGDQGYDTDRAYSIEFRANQNVKGLRFFGGDISYATAANWRIGTFNTSGAIDVIGYGNYFDGFNPVDLDQVGPPRRLIKWLDNVH